jgi:4'-phosphopantetheinyl transferase EntD
MGQPPGLLTILGTMHEQICRLFPETVYAVELSDPARAEPLFPEEAAAVARAVDKRKLEFTLGRTAARHALRALGVGPLPLPHKPDRSVEWPPEVWGSITHADGICAAIASLRAHHAGIGIDAEVRGRVHRELWRHVATAREIAWFEDSADEAEQRARATLLFSAKEAFYKAQFCKSGAWVGFLDAELRFDARENFTVELLIDVGGAFAKGERFAGKYAFTEQHVITGLVLPP